MEDLAREADVARETVLKFENATPEVAARFRRRTVRAMREAFEAHGVEFLDNGRGLGVRLVPARDREEKLGPGDEKP